MMIFQSSSSFLGYTSKAGQTTTLARRYSGDGRTGCYFQRYTVKHQRLPYSIIPAAISMVSLAARQLIRSLMLVLIRRGRGISISATSFMLIYLRKYGISLQAQLKRMDYRIFKM